MDLEILEDILKTEPKFRLVQAKEAVFKQLVNNWKDAKNLPKILQEKLNLFCPLDISAKLFQSQNNNSLKALITLKDSLKIETVLMQHKDGRNTVCLSCQVGCPIGCLFCATGKLGFKRNLEVWEIIEQALFWQRYLKKTSQRVTNVVFMGMGEPLLNYDNVLKAIHILNDQKGFNIGARHISISTVGIVEEIKKLSQEPLQVNLAISLHAPTNELRSKLIPVNKKYPIETIFKTVEDYVKKTKRKVMFEYIMINNVNDSEKEAWKLVELMKNNYLYMVNLIKYNKTSMFRPSSSLTIQKFKNILEGQKINVTERYRFGQDIKAACGQLAG